ncbi:MAG: hypothetical protein RBR38_11045 [Desulfomicrobium apsheronum]|nr:hypothetical protein [Desulfomicrobium apsheronum]
MISALAAAGHLKRVPGGYLVHKVSRDATDDGQTKDSGPTATREALHCNTSQSNNGWTEDRQAKDSELIPEGEPGSHALVELVSGEPWTELAHGGNAETTDEEQTEDTTPTADIEAICSNTSRNNSEGTGNGQAGDSGSIPEEESEARVLIELVSIDPWAELAHGDNVETTDDGQTKDSGPTATREALHCNTSQSNNGWTEDRQAKDSEAIGDELTGVFLDISDLDEPQPTAMTMGTGLRRPNVSTSRVSTPADEASVDARAREMAAEAWDGADARTFEACEGQFDQFWMCRKRHFLELAAQELTVS